MCGIAVLVSKTDSSWTSNVFRATEAISSRGPDDQGFALFRGAEDMPDLRSGPPRHGDHHPEPSRVAFGHRRLSILDLSSMGHQPLAYSGSRYWITYNGEIYNYRELREELQGLGHVFHSRTDTEVILAAYHQWGVEALNRFIGMFAFAILDRQSGKVLVARDQFGIKPLYYWQGSDGVAFASEIKALTRLPQVSRKVNAGRLYQYLTSGLTDVGSQTLLLDVHQIPPGHFAEFKLDSQLHVTPTRYWNVWEAHDKEAGSLTFAQAAEKLRHLFLESVSLHLRSDVPVGAALSGGIDSSAIVMAMRKVHGSNLDLHTFSFVPPDVRISEEKWIDLVAKTSGATQHKITPREGDLQRDIDALIRCQDEPFGSTTIYAQYRVFQLAAHAGIKVMLDGQGADELLAGYFPLYSSRALSLFRSGHPLEAALFLNRVSRRSGFPRTRLARAVADGLVPHSFKRVLKKGPHRASPKWLNPAWFLERGVMLQPLVQTRSGREALKDTLRGALTDAGLPKLLRYEDRNSMVHSIESRVPFLNIRLATFIYSLPESYLIDRNGTTKAVFREAMRGIVPDIILDRKDKIGFATPEKAWLSEMRPWIDQMLNSDFASSLPFLKIQEVRTEWARMLSGDAPFDYRAWRWVNLIRWAELNDIESG